MKVRDPVKHNQEIWRRMTKKDKVNFFVISIIIILLFLSIIAGGIVLGITGKPWFLIGSIAGFIGFGLSFPIVSRIKRKSSFNAIEKSKNTVEAISKITSVWIGWHSYKGSRVKALTLNIKCDINGVESRGWYKFNEEELSNVETEKVMDSSIDSFGNSHIYYRTEISQKALDKLFKIDDEIIIKYIFDKPKYCIVLGKVKS